MKYTVIILVAVMLLAGCRNEKIQKKDYEGQLGKIDNLISGLSKKKEVITVSSRKKKTIVAKDGLKFLFDADLLVAEDGSPVGDSVSIEVAECLNQADFVRANIQTVSNGRLLASTGAYKITMFSQGKKLKLKNNDSLTVYLPRFSDDEMKLFYGQKDSLGRISWIDAGKKLVNSVTVQEAGNSLKKRVNEKGTDSVVSATEEFTKWTDTGKNRESRLAIPVPDTWNSPLKNIAVAPATAMVEYYLPVKISKLNWINCDRFYQVTKKTDIHLDFHTDQDTLAAMVYLIFADINSVTSIPYFRSGKNSINYFFQDVPVNSYVRMVAVSLIKDNLWGFSKDLNIRKNDTVDIKLLPMTVNELDSLINLR